MVDRDFNGWILRSVVGEPNPKTLIKIDTDDWCCRNFFG